MFQWYIAFHYIPPSATAGCTVGETPCIVYLAAGLGTLAVIVVLLVVIVIMLVCVSVRTGKGEPYFSRHDQLEQMFLVHLV